MLHHEDRVAAVAQFLKRFEEFLVVVRMQADARFIENVDHTHEAHAELRGEPHTLRFAAGKRVVVAIERQVAESGFEQETQTLLNARDDLAQGFVAREFSDERGGEGVGIADIEREEFGQVFPADRDGGAAAVEPRAVALGTLAADHERGEARAESVTVGLAETFLQVADDAAERHGLGFAHAFQLKREQPLPRPVEQDVARLGGEVFPRCVGVEGDLFGELTQLRVVFDDEIFSADAPRLDRAALDGFFLIRDDQLGNEAQLATESAARAARAF